MTRIMIIRHAEKPNEGPFSRGVSALGEHDKHELTIRGWQRAGALVRFFSPVTPHPSDGPISQPRAVFAARATRHSPSLRSQHTVQPLAALLGLAVEAEHAEDEEEALARAVLAAPSPVLVAWHHNHIVSLVRALAGPGLRTPTRWPDPRFDLVWVLDRPGAGGAWRFSQVPQLILPGDHAHTIAFDADDACGLPAGGEPT